MRHRAPYIASTGAATGKRRFASSCQKIHDDTAVIEAMALTFRLTSREAEVLYWVVKGKTNRDIGDILALSPRTVTKHLEHVFQKLGVETRTAAARLAISRVRQLA